MTRDEDTMRLLMQIRSLRTRVRCTKPRAAEAMATKATDAIPTDTLGKTYTLYTGAKKIVLRFPQGQKKKAFGTLL